MFAYLGTNYDPFIKNLLSIYSIYNRNKLSKIYNYSSKLLQYPQYENINSTGDFLHNFLHKNRPSKYISKISGIQK